MNTLIIDNYDSFTYNLYQLICELELGEVIVRYNDQVSPDDIRKHEIDAIIISPGPGNPYEKSDIGFCEEMILHSGVPVFGVCLGMQCLVHISGGEIVQAEEPVHGQIDDIYHDGDALFQSIPSAFKAMRYHSLIASVVPQQWRLSAHNSKNIVMAVSHKEKPWWGVQFHPESIGSEYGKEILSNFYRLAKTWNATQRRAQQIPKLKHRRISAADKPQQARATAENLTHWKLLRHDSEWVEPEMVFTAFYLSSENCFWLDSSLPQQGLSRFSIMGDDQGEHAFHAYYNLQQGSWSVQQGQHRQSVKEDAFTWLKQQMRKHHLVNPQAELPFQGGLVGWLGYELKAECGANTQHYSPWPDAAWVFPVRFMVFDHLLKKVHLLHLLHENDNNDKANSWLQESAAALMRLNPSLTTDEFVKPTQGRATQHEEPGLHQDYVEKVERARQYIKQGLSYELCLTHRWQTSYSGRGIDLYRQLRRHNPAPYASFIRLGQLELLSSSPEQFLKIESDGRISSKPIKGTIARGVDAKSDAENLIRLKTNIKDRAENLMIVDLLRNDLGKVCQTGSVNVSQLLHVESYATVHQLISQITASKKPAFDIVDCIQAAFPGGSMTGAPKIRSMSLLEQLEDSFRGIYSGCTGYLSLHNSCDLSINIRCIVLDQNQAYIGSGGAVVWLSQAEAEYQEMCLKARALFEAIDA